MLGATPAGEVDPSRRQVLRAISIGVPTLVAGAYLGRFFLNLSGKSEVHSSTTATGTLPPALTPPADFYEVSKNFNNPNVNAAGWKLELAGLVERPASYSYDQIKARPAQQHIATLECISNEVGDKYISNGQWTGFPLRTLLDEAGIKPGVVDVVLYGADDYSDSIPLAAALDPNTFVVYELGGQPLTPDHGYPLRLLVPNIYGMKNVKWLTKISLVNYDFKGYWQQRGWSDVATIQTMSRIDVPRGSATLPVGQAALVGGIAFAGSRGIKQVQVSFDNAKSWQDARLEPPLSPLSWVRWTYQWTPETQGAFRLAVRAMDGRGEFQTAEVEDPAPNGATGYHKISVRVGPPGTAGADGPAPVATSVPNVNYSP